MSIDVPDMATLLQFVPTAQYGDTIDQMRGCDVPAPFTPADTAPRGGALHLSSVLPALSAAIGAPTTTAGHKEPAELAAALPLLPSDIEGALLVCPTDVHEGFFAVKLRKVK